MKSGQHFPESWHSLNCRKNPLNFGSLKMGEISNDLNFETAQRRVPRGTSFAKWPEKLNTISSMKFSLEIGTVEKHTIQYEFNQLLGTLTIKVNNQPIKKHRRLFDEPLKELHVFMVGVQETLAVKIEKERKLLFGQRNRVFVNDRLIKYCEGV